MANGCVVGAGQNGVHKNLDGQWPKGANSSEIYNVQHPGLPRNVIFPYHVWRPPLPKKRTVKSCCINIVKSC